MSDKAENCPLCGHPARAWMDRTHGDSVQCTNENCRFYLPDNDEMGNYFCLRDWNEQARNSRAARLEAENKRLSAELDAVKIERDRLKNDFEFVARDNAIFGNQLNAAREWARLWRASADFWRDNALYGRPHYKKQTWLGDWYEYEQSEYKYYLECRASEDDLPKADNIRAARVERRENLD